jgi:hypothetical protein
MQIKNAFVMESDFVVAFDELLRKPMPAKQCLEMVTSSEKITEGYDRLMKTQRIILEQFCLLNEEGHLKEGPNGSVVFKDKESEAACIQQISELKSDSLEIPLINKVKVYEDDISTPRKIFLLKDIIEIVERAQPKAA